MTLNLLKLCVGAESFEDQQYWQEQRLLQMLAAGAEQRLVHTTRMVPKRIDELLVGGSLYWVIKGQIQARQQLLAIEPFVDLEGIRRCHLVLGHELIPTQWQPKRAFQGWRYFKAEDVPSDLSTSNKDLPLVLQQELSELGLL